MPSCGSEATHAETRNRRLWGGGVLMLTFSLLIQLLSKLIVVSTIIFGKLDYNINNNIFFIYYAMMAYFGVNASFTFEI